MYPNQKHEFEQSQSHGLNMASDDLPDPFFLDDTLDDPLSARFPPPRVVPSPQPNPLPKPRVIRGLRAPSLFLPIPSVRGHHAIARPSLNLRAAHLLAG